MIMNMKKLIVPALFIFCIFPCACKLETSSATPNSNVNANLNRPGADKPVSSQPVSNCGLTMPAAPSIVGLKLRMTAPEILALFPKSDQDSEIAARLAKAPSKYGEQGFLIRLEDHPSQNKTADITRVDVTLLDGRAYIYNFGYKGPQYPQVNDFVSKFVQGTTLPAAEQWQDYVGLENQLKILTCKDFEVRVFAGGEGGNLNYVLLTDLDAQKTLEERRAKAKAQAKPSTSP
jgi:hypothetical protein